MKNSEGKIGRTSALALLHSAEDYLHVAKLSHNDRDQNPKNFKYGMPIYYLYSHAIEILLKAFLHNKGFTLENLRKDFGHQLLTLWNRCRQEGLELSKDNQLAQAIIEVLDPLAVNYEFRYVITGFKTLPTLEDIRSATSILHAAIRPEVIKPYLNNNWNHHETER